MRNVVFTNRHWCDISITGIPDHHSTLHRVAAHGEYLSDHPTKNFH